MIKILNLTTKTSSHFLKSFFKFSTSSDPYYILGVEKTADYKVIKKSFYKLANEYHPDKNDSADAKKKFILVKQAFEQIKIQKGLMKPQNFVDTVSYDSVRPNADQFTADEQEGYKSTRDYRIFREKASMDDKYSQFNSSFQTIHDINDIKIKVEEGEMKDASQRFNLGSMKAKIVARSQNSMTVVVIGIVGIFLILAFINESFMNAEQNMQKSQIIAHSEVNKQLKIQSDKQRKRKAQVEREKKLKHEELNNIIKPKSDNKDQKVSSKKSSIDERIAWSRIVDEQKEEFMSSNQRVL